MYLFSLFIFIYLRLLLFILVDHVIFADTENEVGEGDLDQDYEIILKRLAKLEKQIARGRKREIEASEMSTKITQAVEGAMRRAVDNVVSSSSLRGDKKN